MPDYSDSESLFSDHESDYKINKKPELRTFEELLLTEEEREERRKKKEEDKELAAYYRSIFEDPESFLKISENPDDDFWEDDTYIWDEDI